MSNGNNANKKSNNSSDNLDEFDITIYGAHKMYSTLIERFGWMLLANQHKSKAKSNLYIRSLGQLIKNLEKKQKTIKDHDIKKDFSIMVENIEYLKEHAEEAFEKDLEILNITNNTKDKNIVEYDMTIYGIHKWYGIMFEKLGWIVLAHKNKDKTRLEEYYRSLLKLYVSIQLKKKSCTHNDRKQDFEIMSNNLKILVNHFKDVRKHNPI
jgi:predicted nuclease of restriction endonuclease-like (RecB) superfamily